MEVIYSVDLSDFYYIMIDSTPESAAFMSNEVYDLAELLDSFYHDMKHSIFDKVASQNVQLPALLAEDAANHLGADGCHVTDYGVKCDGNCRIFVHVDNLPYELSGDIYIGANWLSRGALYIIKNNVRPIIEREFAKAIARSDLSAAFKHYLLSTSNSFTVKGLL